MNSYEIGCYCKEIARLLQVHEYNVVHEIQAMYLIRIDIESLFYAVDEWWGSMPLSIVGADRGYIFANLSYYTRNYFCVNVYLHTSDGKTKMMLIFLFFKEGR